MSDTIDLNIVDKDAWIAVATNPIGLYIKSNDTGRWHLAAMTGEDPPDEDLEGEVYEGQSFRYLESFDGTIYLRADTDEHPFSITDGIGATYSRLTDGFGKPIGSLKGAINVHQADVHNVPANDYVHFHGTATTLAAPASAGDTQIQVVDNTAFIDGVYVHMGVITETREPIHPQVTIQDGGGSIVVLDRPLDFDYADGDTVTVAVIDLAPASVGATLSAPVSLKYRPHSGLVEHIERLLFAMVHSLAGADDRYGGGAALTNGVVLRAHVSGQTGTYTNWKTNLDMKLDMFDVEYSDKAGGGDFGTNGRGSFNRIGVVIRLDPAQEDYIEILLQDTLPVNSQKIKFQGHIEDA